MDRYLIWDFDNTLAYRDGSWTDTLCGLIDKNGFRDYDREKIRKVFRTGFPWNHAYMAHSEYFNGLGWWEFVIGTAIKALDEAGIPGDIGRKAAAGFKGEYLAMDRWHLYEDTVTALKRSLREGFHNMILSNHVPELEKIVAGLGIRGYFMRIVSSAMTDYEKPDRRIFEAAAGDLPRSSCIMIGDNYGNDITGALDYGIDAVLVRKENPERYIKYAKDLSGIWSHVT